MVSFVPLLSIIVHYFPIPTPAHPAYLYRYTDHLGHPGPSGLHPHQLELFQFACVFLITHHLGLFLFFASVSSSVWFVSLSCFCGFPFTCYALWYWKGLWSDICEGAETLSLYTPLCKQVCMFQGKLKTLLQCRFFYPMTASFFTFWSLFTLTGKAFKKSSN